VTRRALRGRIAPITAKPIPDGIVWIDGPLIAAVTASDAPRPAGFEAVTPVDTGGTIFPGLIELHNHLAYNVIGLWLVDKQYSNRDQWPRGAGYQPNLTGPMKVLASDPANLPAITRYVECKALFGGVTATQGVTLSSSAGIRKFFRGLVRNVEETFDPQLPDAKAKIGDVASKDATAFRAALRKAKCYLLHLSEGTDDAAHKHFEALATADPEAIEGSLAGIHCVALKPMDFKRMAAHGASMVWSPLSNLLLYGATSDVKSAAANGVPIGLGPDWAYSGSKNLLGELKVARAVNAVQNLGFSDQQLVEMATIGAARILRWDAHLGSIDAGKRADLVVIGGVAADPLDALFRADERDVRLVMVDGSARYGLASLMNLLSAEGETLKVAGKTRGLCLVGDQEGAPTITMTEATARLTDALAHLPERAKEALKPKPALSALAAREARPQWTLALDEIEPTGVEMRPHLKAAGRFTGMAVAASPVKPLELKALPLDPATFADDAGYIERIALQPNLTPALKEALYDSHGRRPAKGPKGKKHLQLPASHPFLP
jgi:5-methylthioadenosine/S-adenosylhomocysteine deaminase